MNKNWFEDLNILLDTKRLDEFYPTSKMTYCNEQLWLYPPRATKNSEKRIVSLAVNPQFSQSFKNWRCTSLWTHNSPKLLENRNSEILLAVRRFKKSKKWVSIKWQIPKISFVHSTILPLDPWSAVKNTNYIASSSIRLNFDWRG